MKKFNLSTASKTYLTGIFVTVLTLFIISGVIFLLLISNKLDIVMNSKPSDTYTYFIMIMDRILFILTFCAVLPLSIYLWFSKEKTSVDKIICGLSFFIILTFIISFFGGEMRFYNKYTKGELVNSKLFTQQTIEMKFFDKYIK